MRKSRILEIIYKSPKFPFPPRHLIDLIPITFARDMRDKDVYPLVSDQRELITRVARSSFFNIKPRTIHFKEIVEAMNAKDIRNILFTQWLLKFSSAGRYDSLNYEEEQQMWLLSGVFAFTLSKFLGLGNPSDLFLMSMLQDISRLALARSVPEVFASLERTPRNARRLEQIEEKDAGVRHADISAEIAQHWEFPEEFVETIRLHHQVQDNPNFDSPDKNYALMIGFCGRLTEVVLQKKGAWKYGDLENHFCQYFKRKPQEFPNFLRMALENARDYAVPFGLRKLPNFSGLRVLKENPEFLKRHMIPYEELLDELVAVFEQVEQLESALERSRAEMTEFQLRDVLTGLSNHAFFQETLNQELLKSRRYEHPVSLVLFDIDNFRLFNHAYGFSAGNAILKEISDILVKNLRESDTIARYGGDEFAILIPQAGRMRATVVAEKLRKRVEEHQFANPHRDTHHKLTISVGFASVDPRESFMEKNSLLQQTLIALAMAKKAGGNCCRSTDVALSFGVSAG